MAASARGLAIVIGVRWSRHGHRACRAQSLPALTKPVNDLAGVIDAASAAELERRIAALQQQTTDAVVVATVKTFAPFGSIEEYAVKLFERAGIGDRKKDNGVLIARRGRRTARPDRGRLRARRVHHRRLFRRHDSSGLASGVPQRPLRPRLVNGASRIIHRIAEFRGVTLTDVPAPEARAARSADREASFERVIVGIVAVIIIMNIIRKMSGRSRGHPAAPPRFVERLVRRRWRLRWIRRRQFRWRLRRRRVWWLRWRQQRRRWRLGPLVNRQLRPLPLPDCLIAPIASLPHCLIAPLPHCP